MKMKDKEKKNSRHFNYQLFYRRTALIIYDIPVSYTHLDVYKRQAKIFEWLTEMIEQEKSPRQQECGRNGRLHEEIG